jgi:LacI family transcriptional regulator
MVMVVGYNINWASAHGIYEEILDEAIQTLQHHDIRVYMDMNNTWQNQDEWSAMMMHGALVLPGNRQKTTRMLQQMEVPYVVINDKPADKQECCVYVDDYQGARDAVEHLMSLGHRRIAYKSEIKNIPSGRSLIGKATHYSQTDRRQGYVDAMAAHGLKPMPGYDLNISTEQYLDEYLLKQQATAVVLWENTQAVHLFRLCEQRHMRVPEDLSVLCFNDITYDSIPDDFFSVISLPTVQLGRHSAQMLMDQMASPIGDVGKQQLLPERMIARKSTGQSVAVVNHL